MGVAIVVVAIVVVIAVGVALTSRKVWQRVQHLRVMAHSAVPIPSVEWVIRSALDQVIASSTATLRGKIMPRHVTVIVSDENYVRLEPGWPQIAQDMSDEIVATARAEGWECGGVTFGVRANSSLGRRQVRVALTYPSSGDIPTSHAAEGRRRLARGRTEATLSVGGNEPANWYVEQNGAPPLLLRPGFDVLIGAAPNCDVIIDSPRVSRRHLRLQRSQRADLVEVEDLHSTNGTSIGRTKLAPEIPVAVTQTSTVKLGKTDSIQIIRRTASSGSS
jgi:FHA domain-containing protein